MNRVAAILFTLLWTTVCASAQTFLQHLQQPKQGAGTVVVKQSKAIDDLVNGTPHVAITAPTKVEKKATTTQKQTVAATKQPSHTATTPPQKKQTTTTEQPTTDVDTETTPIDMRKKVMRRSYKVDGYRVQVFAGGNSRNDKIKAQRAGNDIKQAFPEQPIYVHFYSPRWICRMGNYRTYEEANEFLRQVKKLGFTEACIVSGKIVVPY